MTDFVKFNNGALVNGDVVQLFHSEILFIKGMSITSIYIITKGTILIFSSDGARLQRWAGPNQILGINELLCGGEWQGIGVAQGNVELVAYSQMNLRSVIDKIPKAHKHLLDALILPSPKDNAES
ncbi:cyclic nucleotide-binding domain-containing protein [Sulfitobacter sp.]|nr:cyclic nucleotide-binding domain-containing protein [Sulfitobacter sp.]